MKSTKQTRRDAKQLFRSCLDKGVLSETRVREAVTQVAAAKPRGYIGILTQFQRLVKLELDRRAARVESPVPLSADSQAEVTRRLGALYGQGLDVSFVRNAALIGGLRIKVGSDVYDGSVQSRLAALQEHF